MNGDIRQFLLVADFVLVTLERHWFLAPGLLCRRVERYWIPELFAAVQRKERRSSKSFVVPSFQIRNVLPWAGFSAVVSPRMAPSLTDQSEGSPSQPVRSLPLKMRVMPGVSVPSGARRYGVKDSREGGEQEKGRAHKILCSGCWQYGQVALLQRLLRRPKASACVSPVKT